MRTLDIMKAVFATFHECIQNVLAGPHTNPKSKNDLQSKCKLPTSLTVSLVSKRYMRGVAEIKFSRLFVQISTIAPVCLVRFGEENGKIIDVI